jgi:uncharacterized membrane protein
MSAVTHALPLGGSRLWPKIGWAFLLLFAILAGVNAVLVATVHGYEAAEQYDRMFTLRAIGYAHTLGGAIAMFIGPFQFLGAVRRRYPRVHVWLGRTYLTSVALSALAGLYLSPDSNARNTLGIAFIALALAWLYTGWQAYATIRRRDVSTHRRWMIRNYALTYAAVTLRMEMPLLIILGVSPQRSLDIIGWACWVPNLIIVEMWMRRRRSSAPRPAIA